MVHIFFILKDYFLIARLSSLTVVVFLTPKIWVQIPLKFTRFSAQMDTKIAVNVPFYKLNHLNTNFFLRNSLTFDQLRQQKDDDEG